MTRAFRIAATTYMLISICASNALADVDIQYTIPVVVHVVHPGVPIGAPDNPDDSLIHAMLRQMNAAFQKDGPFFGGADPEIEFRLATRSPECSSTTGIVRVDGSGVENYVTGGITSDSFYFPASAHEYFVKALSRWPNTDYLNIWIVHLIDGNPFWPGGYAYYPYLNSALYDGVVLRSSVVNGTNKTIIHELGHYFWLAHTFGDAWEFCMSESNCLTEGDYICDTENCMYAFDCSAMTNPCSGMPWEIADDAFDYTVLNNYMGYTDCQWMFTEDQKARMHNAIDAFRSGFRSSGALRGENAYSPVIACIPLALQDYSPFYGIERVEIGELNVYSNTSEADQAHYVDRTCNQVAYVREGDEVLIRVTGSYENWQYHRVYIDYDQNGEFEIPAEEVLSAEGSISENTIIIPANTADCYPYRVRVISENPFAQEPDPCTLYGTPDEGGVGQIEDFGLHISPAAITSLSSGNWNAASSWSCNCIPGPDDAVVIGSGDTITVPSMMQGFSCYSVDIQASGMLYVDGILHVETNCPE